MTSTLILFPKHSIRFNAFSKNLGGEGKTLLGRPNIGLPV